MRPNYKPFSEFLPKEEEIDVWVDAIKVMAGRMSPEDYVEKALACPPEKAFVYGYFYNRITNQDLLVAQLETDILAFLTRYPDKARKIMEIIMEDDKNG